MDKAENSTPQKNSNTATTTQPNEPLVGGDRDAHGCIGSAGYTWCEGSKKCLRVFEEFCPGGSETQNFYLAGIVQGLLGAKYAKDPSNFYVTIVQQTESHLRGDITFLDAKKKPVAGAIFLAAKIDGKWKLVFDGNGQISCGFVKQGFPGEMLFDCN